MNSLSKGVRAFHASILRLNPAVRNLGVVTLLLLLMFLQLFRGSPFIANYPGHDSGIFLYGGQQINLGKIPYLDFWDHKPPLVFYINALGLRLSGDEAWGVWLIEFSLLCLSVSLCYYICYKLFGTLPALFASILFIVSLRTVAMINGTETYAIPFAFLALWAFLKYLKNHAWIYLLVIGLAAAGSFLLKPNLIGFAVGIGVSLLLYPHWNWKSAFAKIGLLAVGFLIPVISFVLYFQLHQALAEFWDVAYAYNQYYFTYRLDDFLSAIFFGFQTLSEPGIMIPATIGWVCGLFLRKQGGAIDPFLRAAIIGLPLEMILASMSGRRFEHYFTIWLPLLAVLAAFFGYIMITNTKSVVLKPDRLHIKLPIGVLILGLYAFLLVATFFTDNTLRWIWRSAEEGAPSVHAEVLSLVPSLTNPDDTVVFWGAGSRYNFLTRRASPSRFSFHSPLFTPGYSSEAIILEFYNDLVDNQPKLIVDTKEPFPENFPPMTRYARQKWLEAGNQMPNEANVIFDYIDANYTSMGIPGSDGWEVFVRK